MDEYMVIFWNTSDHHQWTPTMVHQAKTETVKDVQDKIADYAGKNPHIIYMVVKKSDYYGFFQTGFWHKEK